MSASLYADLVFPLNFSHTVPNTSDQLFHQERKFGKWRYFWRMMKGLLFSKEKDVPFVIYTINKQHSHVDGCWSSFNWVVGFMIQVVQLLLIRWNSVQSMCIWIVITKEQYKQASKGNIIHIPFTENTCLAFIPLVFLPICFCILSALWLH